MIVLSNGKLKKAVVGALMGGLVFGGIAGDLPRSEAKSTSLYEEYQASQKSKNEDVVRQNKTLAEADNVVEEAAGEVPGNGPSDFLNRIRNIISSAKIPENKYSRFLVKAKEYIEQNPDLEELVSVYDPEQAGGALEPNESQYKPPIGEGRYSFNWQGTPIAQSLYALGSIAHKGIVVNGAINDKVYAKLDKVTVDEALDYLARAFNLNWMVEGNNIIITVNDKMLQSAVMEVEYADKDKMKQEFMSLGIDDKNIYVNSESGTISITGTPYQISEAKKRVKLIDKPVLQCLLAAQLIEITHGKNLNLGLTYQLPTYTHTGDENATSESLHGPWLPKLTFGATLQAERALSKGKVISRPIVLSRNGEPAKVKFGDQVPIMSTTSTATSTNVSVDYKDVGTNLEVTPVINAKSGDISLKISAEVSNIVQYVTQGSTRAPQIATRQINTVAHVKNGQSLVIGGLMSVTDLDNLSGIPGLMNLPILGELFKFHNRSKSYAEVYIMLTPFIMDDGIDAREVARKVEY